MWSRFYSLSCAYQKLLKLKLCLECKKCISTCNSALVSLDDVLDPDSIVLVNIGTNEDRWHCQTFILDQSFFHVHEHLHIAVHTRWALNKALMLPFYVLHNILHLL